MRFPELSVDLVLDETRHLCHLESEVTLVLTNLVAVALQEGSDAGILTLVGCCRVESDDIARLCVSKLFLLRLVVEVNRHQRLVAQGDTTLESVAVSVKLAEVALQHVALLRIVNIGLGIAAGTACEHVNLLVDKVVVDLDIIVCHLVAA